jgi:hypothetical protein
MVFFTKGLPASAFRFRHQIEHSATGFVKMVSFQLS